MEKKIGLMFGLILAFVMILNFASATVTVTGIPSSLSQSGGSFDIVVASDTSETLALSVSDLTQDSKIVDFSLNDTSLTLNNSNSSVKVTYSIGAGFTFNLGKEYNSTLTINGTSSPIYTKEMKFTDTKFCEFGKKGGDLEITGIDINNIGAGDDNEWEYLDKIEIKLSVENTDQDTSISSVEAEIRIVDLEGRDITNDFFENNDDKKIDFGKIKYNTEETESTTLKVDPTIDEGTYKLYIKAYKKSDEDVHCIDESNDFNTDDTYQEIKVLVGDKEVGIDNFDFPSTIACGAPATVSFDFYNFDLAEKEEDMRVGIYNADLGINTYSTQFDLRRGKSNGLVFDIEIPKDAKPGRYKTNIRYEYDYDTDKLRYDTSDQASQTFDLVVEGGCKIANPTISVNLESAEVVAGKDMVIKVNVKNDDSENATFNVNAEGFGSWATLKEVNPSNFILASGASKDVYLTFNLKDSSAGEQNFNLIVTGNGFVLANKPVLVSVEEGSFFGNLFNGFDWKIWGIIILNVILLIAIIIVARRVLSRR
ncbi:putative S-layer protein [archaeon]|nr:putative S-layer protein [archaeon]